MIRAFLSRRRKGAMAMVTLAALVPVSAMMSANINTSQMVDDRRQTQDAVDALATMHGTWSARALNIISMNNVTAAQLLSVSVGSEALFFTNNEIIIAAGLASGRIAGHAGQECNYRTPPPASILESAWVATCGTWHTLLTIPAQLAMIRAWDSNSDFDPVHGIKTATKALEAIDGMNTALARRHPRAMAEIAEDYRTLLDINDHHFADPCDGPVPNNTCRQTNTGDGMALPLESAEFAARLRLQTVMKVGTTANDTTFAARGFPRGKGPLDHGGSQTRPKLDQHINNITEIGNTLYEFDRFYDSRISHMPRHPLSGPGSALFPGFPGFEEPAYAGDPFIDRKRDLWDTLEPIYEGIIPILRTVLGIARNVYIFGFDEHNTYLFQSEQGRTRNNSFFRNYNTAYGAILMGDVRTNFPLGFDIGRLELVTMSPVPETFQLEDIDPGPWNILPPVEAKTMPEAFHILGYALKEKASRLSEVVVPSTVSTHTGYGQSGVFNPDGATLYSQNWQSQLMPATRLDDVRRASRDLARQARSGFDDLAQTLQEVQTPSSWGRVNAH